MYKGRGCMNAMNNYVSTILVFYYDGYRLKSKETKTTPIEYCLKYWTIVCRGRHSCIVNLPRSGHFIEHIRLP